MTNPIEQHDSAFELETKGASEQLSRAETVLGAATEAVNRRPDILDVNERRQKDIRENLTKCHGHIVELQSDELISKKNLIRIRAAVTCLKTVQTALEPTESVDARDILKMTARARALLYPISTKIEQEAELSAAPRRSSISSSPPGMESSRFQNRRSSLRRVVEADIGLCANTLFFTGSSEDISAGGLFVSTYDILHVGEKVNVNFFLPKGPALSMDGIVRWVREFNEMIPEMMPGMGIQFENFSETEITLINHCMSSI